MEERLTKQNEYPDGEGRFNVISDPLVRASVKAFYEKYYDPEKQIRWWAGLFDPDIGGFYYANSARDGEGFLPDLPAFLGEELTQKIVRFYQIKQDKDDGYFYHPQWTRDQSRKNVMRYTRDQDWAIFVLDWLGAKPLYPTAIDRAAGQNGKTSSPDWRPNANSVTSYVERLLAETSCEHWGNQLETQATTFKATGTIGTVLDVLDRRINPEYGLWVSGYDAEKDLYYNKMTAPEPETPYGIFTNTYKVVKTYNIGGRRAPGAIQTVRNAIKAICSRDPGIRLTYIFNPWATLGNVRENLVRYGTSGEVSAYDRLIRENVVEMIDALGCSLGKYLHRDGSYSYLQRGSKETIYSTPVSLGLEEGDVNGNNLALLCATHICTAIGLSDMIPIFGQHHAELMLDLLKNAPPIKKK